MKPSTKIIKPTTLMASDLTLKGLFAMNAPDVPEWYIDKRTIDDSFNGETDEEVFIQWLEYYADLMIKHFGK